MGKKVYLSLFSIKKDFFPQTKSILKVFLPEASVTSFPNFVAARCPDLISPLPACHWLQETKENNSVNLSFSCHGPWGAVW